MKYYVVKFTGPFGFIKPWTAVRDASGGETYSQQFLTPSIVEGIRQKLEVKSILRHRLIYAGIDVQQEVVQAKAWSKKGKQYIKERSILKRGVMLYPSLYLAFEYSDDAERAALLPDASIKEMTQEEFDRLDGYELRFETNSDSFLVGYNRFKENEEMVGYIEIVGNPVQKERYEQL